jgi:hypothetical protein
MLVAMEIHDLDDVANLGHCSDVQRGLSMGIHPEIASDSAREGWIYYPGNCLFM